MKMMNFFKLGSKSEPKPKSKRYTQAIPNLDSQMYTLNTSNQPIISLLKSSNQQDQLKAMRLLTAMHFSRKDTSAFLPYVVNIVSQNYRLNKLVYFFLSHSCGIGSQQILLSINSFLKAIKQKSPLAKACGIRTLSSLHIEQIQNLVASEIPKTVTDSSIFVRKASAYALIKMNQWDDANHELLISSLMKLVSDASPLVVGSALLAFSSICPQRLDLLHGFYRRLCKELENFESLFIPNAVYVLASYARTYLDKEFIEEGAGKDPDLKLFLDCCQDLLVYDSPSVLVSVAQTFLMFSHQSLYQKTVLALLQFNNHPFHLAYLLLLMLNEFSKLTPEHFKSILPYFFLHQYERKELSLIKLEILGRIVSELTIHQILSELGHYGYWESQEISIKSIQTVQTIVQNFPQFSQICIKKLVTLFQSQSPVVTAQVVIILRRLIQKNPVSKQKIIVQCAMIFQTIKFPNAKASAIWIIGNYFNMIPTLATEIMRKLCLTYTKQHPIVKHQILNSVVKMVIAAEEPLNAKLVAFLSHLLNVSYYDLSYDIRDKARILSAIFLSKEIQIDPEKLFLIQEPEQEKKVQSAYFPLTLSFLIKKKVSGYSKHWECLLDKEMLEQTLKVDSSEFRTEEQAPVIRVPAVTSISSQDMPQIRGTGIQARVAYTPPQTLNEFLDSSDKEYSEYSEYSESGSEESQDSQLNGQYFSVFK